MDRNKNLAEQTRSLIDRLNVRQTMISNQLKTITNEKTGILKKSKSVSFLDNESQMKVQIFFEQILNFILFLHQTLIQPRSILKKQEDINEDKCPLEPFVVNIPDNISRVDIDQYLKNVQDQRRKGLNYSYNTDDDDEEEEEKNESQEIVQKTKEPWNEV